MSDIFDEIARLYKIFKTKPASEEQIKEAEKKLGRTFPKEYRDYLKRFGAISFSNTELTGLNVDKYANVVDVTLREMELNENFPKDCIVLENVGVDGVLILINSKGEVFEWDGNTLRKIYDSIEDYLRSKL